MAIVVLVSEEWLDRLRHEGEAFEREVSAAHLSNLRGLEIEAPLERIYEKHSKILGSATFERLEELLEETEEAPLASLDATATTQRELALLLEFVGTHLERKATAEVVAKRLALEAKLTVDVDGEQVSFRSLTRKIRSCSDRGRRDALERAQVSAREKVSELIVEAHGRSRDAAADVGGEDYIRWRSRLGRFDIDDLAVEAAALLDGTDDMAEDALSWLFKGRVDASNRDALRSHDLLFAMRASDLDGLLSPGELWRIDSFFERLGIDPHGGGRIIRDTEARQGKSDRAYCVPLRVPDRVFLVLPESGGLPQWRALLHELGHAVHNANIDPLRPFEHRYLGDASVSEGYATLFDHLLLNPVWVKKVLSLSPEKTDRLVRTAASVALMITRRNTAKLLFEINYHRSTDSPELYVDLLRRASGVIPSAAGHLCEIDPELYSSRYIRAWMFEGLAHRELRERFDEDWFLNPRAGTYFQRLFATGQARDLHEIATQELDGSLDHKHVVERFEEIL